MVVRVNIKEHIGRSPPPWWKRLPNRWPFLIWVGAVVLAVFLFSRGGQMGGMTGSVRSSRQIIAPLEDSRIKAIHVELGQEVRKGDLLVEMDTTVLDAEMAVEQLQAERQFALVEFRAETTLKTTRIRQAEAQGEVDVLNTEVERLESLLSRQLVDAQTVARMKARQQALKSGLELYPEMIESLEAQLADARARRLAMDASMLAGVDDGEMGYAGEIDFSQAADRLGLLRLRRQSYRLYAHEDGIVSRVLQAPGDVIAAGLPILTVIGKEVTHVEGFLPESATARNVRVGMPAYISSTTAMGPITRAIVIAVTPDVMALPTRINPVPDRELRGRRVVLRLTDTHDLLPGETVTIQFERPLLSLLFSRRGQGEGVATVDEP